MIVANGTLVISNKEFHLKMVFSQAMIAKRFVLLVKQRYQIDCDLYTIKRPNLRKGIFMMLYQDKVKDILEDVGLYKANTLDKRYHEHY